MSIPTLLTWHTATVQVAFDKARRTMRRVVVEERQCGRVECWLATNASNNYGYHQVRWGDVKPFVHHLAALVGGQTLVADRRIHVSHLCGNRACFNPDHVTVESQAVNEQRKYCRRWVKCPRCTDVIDNCPHTPSCLQ